MRKMTLALAAAATLGFGMIAADEASARPGHGWRGHHGHAFARHHWRYRHWGWRGPASGAWAGPPACQWARVRTPWGPRWRRVCL